jgi:hypothetical protein
MPVLTQYEPTLDNGKNTSCSITLTDADTVYTVAIPSWAHWVRIRPDKDIRFALGENPPAAEPAKVGNAATTDFGIGNYAFASEWTDYLMPRHISSMYTLNLLCDQAGAVVRVCFAGG